MGHRVTSLPLDGRPDHAASDGYPQVVNMKVPPYACVECLVPCDEDAFRFGKPDCERRHAGSGGYRDRQERFEGWVGRMLVDEVATPDRQGKGSGS